MVNDKFVQIEGPFTSGEEVVDKIKANYPDFQYIKKLGIQCESTHHCSINGQNFEIGKTEILEINDVRVTSVIFLQDESQRTLVDCCLG